MVISRGKMRALFIFLRMSGNDSILFFLLFCDGTSEHKVDVKRYENESGDDQYEDGYPMRTSICLPFERSQSEAEKPKTGQIKVQEARIISFRF